jgi:hypothetical protein
MRLFTPKIVAAVAAVAAVGAAGGAALTEGNNFPTSTTAGYASTNVSGATVKSIHYTLSADGKTIDQLELVIAGDVTQKIVKAGFGTQALTECTIKAAVGPDTSAKCGFTNEDTSAAKQLNVAVYDN